MAESLKVLHSFKFIGLISTILMADYNNGFFVLDI